MEVKTKDLKKIFDIIIKTLEESGNSTIDLDYDLYWNIFFENGQKIYETPKPVVSDLREDWEVLGKILTDEFPIHFDCERLGKILAAIGLKKQI